MSLAMSALPVAVSVPATAQLLLPTAGGACAGTTDAAAASRTFSTLASGTGAPDRALGGAASGASQEVPAGYRNPSTHFQPPAQAGPPRRALISRRRISRRRPFACRSHHIE